MYINYILYDFYDFFNVIWLIIKDFQGHRMITMGWKGGNFWGYYLKQTVMLAAVGFLPDQQICQWWFSRFFKVIRWFSMSKVEISFIFMVTAKIQVFSRFFKVSRSGTIWNCYISPQMLFFLLEMWVYHTIIKSMYPSPLKENFWEIGNKMHVLACRKHTFL